MAVGCECQREDEEGLDVPAGTDHKEEDVKAWNAGWVWGWSGWRGRRCHNRGLKRDRSDHHCAHIIWDVQVYFAITADVH